jgi:hypothetical protein
LCEGNDVLQRPNRSTTSHDPVVSALRQQINALEAGSLRPLKKRCNSVVEKGMEVQHVVAVDGTLSGLGFEFMCG